MANGTVQYYTKNHVLNRKNAPAVIKSDGTEYYYSKGQLHRTDGPVVIQPDGNFLYYDNGIPLLAKSIMESLGEDYVTNS